MNKKQVSQEATEEEQGQEVQTGKRPHMRARGSNQQGQEARIAQEAQQEEEHGVVESKWRKTGGVMIPAIALVDVGKRYFPL